MEMKVSTRKTLMGFAFVFALLEMGVFIWGIIALRITVKMFYANYFRILLDRVMWFLLTIGSAVGSMRKKKTLLFCCAFAQIICFLQPMQSIFLVNADLLSIYQRGLNYLLMILVNVLLMATASDKMKANAALPLSLAISAINCILYVVARAVATGSVNIRLGWFLSNTHLFYCLSISFIIAIYLPAKAKENTTPKTVQISAVDETENLARLAKLHEQGILTDEEFEQQKASILAKI